MEGKEFYYLHSIKTAEFSAHLYLKKHLKMKILKHFYCSERNTPAKIPRPPTRGSLTQTGARRSCWERDTTGKILDLCVCVFCLFIMYELPCDFVGRLNFGALSVDVIAPFCII